MGPDNSSRGSEPRAQVIAGWVSNNDTDLEFYLLGDAEDLTYRYLVSMYSVFFGKFAFTAWEHFFGMVAQLAIGFIFGALASLMSTVVATDAAAQQEIQSKLTAVKAWTQDRDLPKQDRTRVLKHFSSQYSFAMYDAPLAIATPRNCSWAPGNILYCKSTGKCLLL